MSGSNNSNGNSNSNGNGDGSSVPPAAKGSWSSFLKSITSFSGDLSSLTAPPFILSGTSLVEFSAYWTEHPSVFAAPASEPDPAKRALLVLKWFLTTLKQQYASRSENLGSEKKPLNPFLGELFFGKWEDDAGTTQLVSEQVSHHPPVTAYSIWNTKAGMHLQGYNGQKASVSRSLTIVVKQIGHAILHIDEYNEDYLITLPSLHIEGLYKGSPYVELDRHTYIQSSSGYTSKIEYTGAGWLSGKKNSFTATLYKTSSLEKEPLYSVEGQWTEAFTIHAGKKSGGVVDTWDPTKHHITDLSVAPIEEQGPLESRRAWQQVAQAIYRGDMDATSHYKGIIENEQREMRRKEREEAREWERRYFSRQEGDGLFERLAQPIGEQLEPEKTDGVWRWDEDKANEATPQFSTQEYY